MDLIKCLLVDDDELEREMIAQYLDGVAACDMAVNGREAVDKFKAAHDEGSPYDLLIMDIMMPEMDGHAAGREIRRFEREKGISMVNQVKILILSALNTPMDAMESFMAAQSAAHLSKPIGKDKLREALSKLGLRKG
jgi:two-component system chemotaxis response regulator CheY